MKNHAHYRHGIRNVLRLVRDEHSPESTNAEREATPIHRLRIAWLSWLARNFTPRDLEQQDPPVSFDDWRNGADAVPERRCPICGQLLPVNAHPTQRYWPPKCRVVADRKARRQRRQRRLDERRKEEATRERRRAQWRAYARRNIEKRRAWQRAYEARKRAQSGTA